MAGGIGGFLSGIFGGQNDFQAGVQGPDRTLFQDPDAAANRQMLQSAMANARQVAPTAAAAQAQAASIDQAAQDQFRQQQAGLASQLAATAAGRGPSLAAMQGSESLRQQLAAQQSAAASAGADVNPALMRRGLMQNAAQAALGTAGQIMQGRLSEQMAAQQALGGLAAQARGQDVDLATQQAQLRQQALMQNAGFSQQANLANQQAMLQQQGINNQSQQFAMGNLLQQSEANRQAMMGYAGMDQQTALQNQAVNARVAGQNAESAGRYGGAVLGGLTQGASFLAGKLPFLSDERAKTRVDREHVDRDMTEFLRELDPASYDYKDQSNGHGRHWSVMAQSAARSKAGRSFVEQRPDGLLQLDTRKSAGVTLAALAHLHRRQERLESLAERALKRHA